MSKNKNIYVYETQFQRNWRITMREIAEFNHDLERKRNYPKQSFKVTGELSGEYYQQRNK